jgi:hypothetical protein
MQGKLRKIQRRQDGLVLVQRCFDDRHSSQDPTRRFSTPAALKMSSADFCISLREMNSLCGLKPGHPTPSRRQFRHSGIVLSHLT